MIYIQQTYHYLISNTNKKRRSISVQIYSLKNPVWQTKKNIFEDNLNNISFAPHSIHIQFGRNQ